MKSWDRKNPQKEMQAKEAPHSPQDQSQGTEWIPLISRLYPAPRRHVTGKLLK